MVVIALEGWLRCTTCGEKRKYVLHVFCENRCEMRDMGEGGDVEIRRGREMRLPLSVGLGFGKAGQGARGAKYFSSWLTCMSPISFMFLVNLKATPLFLGMNTSICSHVALALIDSIPPSLFICSVVR